MRKIVIMIHPNILINFGTIKGKSTKVLKFDAKFLEFLVIRFEGWDILDWIEFL